MAKLSGRVTIVQEGRFQVIDDDGAGHLFILSPHASAETTQLRALADLQSRVTVTYRDVALMIGLVADRIDVEAA